ncbi:hypothetical protein AB0K52_22030 [Glycomyces sp. NPDC049804]|uniref:hypothetical protein n=1 Tax=Glycomyces sp. NPDC049804 TaxID=3154363 RepID=UPI00342B7BD3
MSARDRFRIAVDALGWAMATTERPIEDAGLTASVDRILATLRAALQQGRTLAEATPQALSELTQQQKQAEAPGTMGIVLALGLCFDELDAVLTPSRALEILGQCYEFELVRICPDPIVTRAFEERSPRMRVILDYQQALLTTEWPGSVPSQVVKRPAARRPQPHSRSCREWISSCI